MSEKVACPKCGEQNYSTDRECLSCGAALVTASSPPPVPPPTIPENTPIPRPLPRLTMTGDDRSWWRRRTDDVISYQFGALMGLLAVSLGLSGLTALSVGFAAGFSMLIGLSIAAFCFIWYTRDPDTLLPLIACIVFSSLFGWIFIAFGAFVGAALEKQLSRAESQS